MRKLISVLFAITVIAAALMPVTANADFAKGEVLNHMLSVCLNKADAVAIMKEHSTKGRAAADVLWEKAGECANIPVEGPVVGETVLSIPVETDGVKKIARVIEIIKNGSVLGYFMTTSPMKTERDA